MRRKGIHMLERFTADGRKPIIFGMYEALLAGSEKVELMHLLLGVARGLVSSRSPLGEISGIKTLKSKISGPILNVNDRNINYSDQCIAAFVLADQTALLLGRSIGLPYLLYAILMQRDVEITAIFEPLNETLEKVRRVGGISSAA